MMFLFFFFPLEFVLKKIEASRGKVSEYKVEVAWCASCCLQPEPLKKMLA